MKATAYSVLILGVLALVLPLVGALGSRFELFTFRIGFGLLGLALLVSVVAVIVGLVSGFLSWKHPETFWLRITVGGLVMALVFPFYFVAQLQGVRGTPFINHVSTDTDDPPAFNVIRDVRPDDAAPLEYTPLIRRLQQGFYTDLRTYNSALSVEPMFELATEVAADMGWQLYESDDNASNYAIEATATSFWFGFKDDLVIRIRSQPEGSFVDVRSVSRVGRTDIGTNAKRIQAYFDRLRAQDEARRD